MGRKILIADDSVSTRKDLQTFLIAQGFEVVAVGNGDLAARRAGEMRPEMAMIDLLMPGKNGYEVTSHIKHTLGLPIPVLLMHSEFEPLDPKEFLKCGADHLLQKPLDAVTLLDKMVEAFRQYGLDDAAVAPPPESSWADVAEDVQAVPEEDRSFPPEWAGSGNAAGFLSVEEVPQSATVQDLSHEIGIHKQLGEVSVAPEAGPSSDSQAALPDLEFPSTPLWMKEPPAPVAPEEAPPVAAEAEVEESLDYTVVPGQNPIVEEPAAEPEEMLDDPYAVAMSGTYKAFFEEASTPQPLPPLPEPPPPVVAPEPAPVREEVVLTNEEEELLDSIFKEPEKVVDTFDGLRQALPPVNVVAVDPHPTPNPFAPLPAAPVPLRDFVVPLTQTAEIPIDPASGTSISFDAKQGTVQIDGLWQSGQHKIAVSEVQIPYQSSDSLAKVAEPISGFYDDRRIAELESSPVDPTPTGETKFEVAEVDFPSTGDEVLERITAEFAADIEENDLSAASTSPVQPAVNPPVSGTDYIHHTEITGSLPIEFEVPPSAMVEKSQSDPFADSLFSIPPEMEVRVCSDCGSPAEEGDLFCRVCNATLGGLTGQFDRIDFIQTEQLVCRHCGSGINEGDVFCLKCGEVI
ncbi:MAG: response regulator [Blastocatellia bacterium]|nr:response regulator [Blastocatellia bacterium]